MAQQQNEPELPDGERLNKLKREQRYTWAEIATDIGVSTSMIHMVRRGEKRLGREPSARLALIETAGRPATGNLGEHESKPDATGSPEGAEPPAHHPGSDELLGHIVWLEDQLSYARTKEERLLKIIEAMAGLGEGHAHDAEAPPPAAPASGVRYSTRKTKSA